MQLWAPARALSSGSEASLGAQPFPVVSGKTDWVLALFHERAVLMKQEDKGMNKENTWVVAVNLNRLCHWDAFELHVSYINFLIIVSVLEFPWVHLLTVSNQIGGFCLLGAERVESRAESDYRLNRFKFEQSSYVCVCD